MFIHKLMAISFFGALVTVQAQAGMVNLNTLGKALSDNNAGWQAKDTWLNELSQEQLQKVLGYKQKVAQAKDFYLQERMNQNTGTEAIDWRNYKGQNWVSPILNQGNCGSCVAFASVGTLETQMNISRSASWLDPRYSEEALFSCGGGGCDSGWSPDGAASYLQSNGVPDEACAPYTMGATGTDVSCSSICSDASSRTQQISNFTTANNFDDVKAALKHGPVVTTIDVYADFLVYSSGVYKHTAGDYEGGHAVSIIGFDDVHRYWIVRNSWGKDWGENGFIRISYDDTSGVGNETWSYQIPDADGVATIRNLHDRDYFSGSMTFDAVSTYPHTGGIALQLTRPQGKQSSMSCKSSICSFPLDSTKLADGRYEANLLVDNAGRKIETEKKFFYIANSRPAKMEITMQPASDVDLTNPIQGRVEFNVDTLSSTVPFSSLTFTVMQGSKVVETRDTDVVLPNMVMGWRTTVVPNGVYDIYLQGTINIGARHYQANSNHFKVTVQN